MDIAKCPLEAFAFVNKFAGDHRITIFLLHVINLNVVLPETRLFRELATAAEQHLHRLAETFLNPGLSFRCCVRIGKPATEILAEAKESRVDLIVLASTGDSSRWNRVFHPRVLEKVLRTSPCNVTVLRARTRFNCERDWQWLRNVAGVLDDAVGLLKLPVPRLL